MNAIIKSCDVIDAAIRKVCRIILYVTTVVLFLVLSINVFLRYLAGNSLSSAGEIPELIFPWLVMAGVVLASQHGAHIAISWLVDKLSDSMRKVVAILNCGILIAAYSLLAWGTYTLMPIVSDERTQVLKVPSSVTYSCMLIAFVFLVITSLTQMARLFISKAPPPPAMTITEAA